MYDVQFAPSGLASLRVVRAVERQLPAAVEAVEAHLGEAVPPLTVTIAGPVGMAIAQTLAAKDRRSSWRQAAGRYREALYNTRSAIGMTTATRTGRTLITLRGDKLRWAPGEIYPTLVHELVHAVQCVRPGTPALEQAGLDRDWGLADRPESECHIVEALTAIEEAEAYAVERALNPRAEAEGTFDRAAMVCRLVDAVAHWQTATTPAGIRWTEAA